MKTYGITTYTTGHSMFRTDAWFEVYVMESENDRGTAIVLFADKADAEAFMEAKNERL